MSDMTNTFEDAVINVYFRGGSHTGTQLWVALFISGAPPSETAGGTEVSGGWYARQSPGATPSSAWADPTGVGLTSNSTQLTWAAVTGAAVNVGSVAIMSAVSGGTMWMYKVLGAPVVYNIGDIPIILSGGLQVQFQ